MSVHLSSAGSARSAAEGRCFPETLSASCLTDLAVGPTASAASSLGEGFVGPSRGWCR